jgi:23S rRNA (cytosine1962-C5)-methyltransferase
MSKQGYSDNRRNRPPQKKDAIARPKNSQNPPLDDAGFKNTKANSDAHTAPAIREFIPPPDAGLPAGTPVVSLRSVAGGTFVYQKMINHVAGSPKDGDLVAVRERNGRFYGWAFYHSRSQIALRMFSYAQERPDDAFFRRRIAQAVSLRRDLLKLDEVSDTYRVIHAEGDGLTGLIVDRFGGYVVIELFSLAMFQRLKLIEDALIDAGLRVEAFLVRVDKIIAEQEGIRLDKVTEPKVPQVTVTEQGVRFSVNLAKGHKTGFFCDQRENRLALTQLTPGKSVLDVCCYSGGFAVYAATRGQAAEVTGIDLDEKALVVAKQNARLNDVKIEFTHADAFDYLRQANEQHRQWDVVIVDPSKFVPRRDAMDSGLRKYADLNRLAAGVVKPGGIMLTCSCSGLVSQDTFVQVVGRAVKAAGRTMQIFRLSGAGPDHPFQADTSESQYLKAVWSRLD